MQIDPIRLRCSDLFICKYARHTEWKGPYVLSGSSYAGGSSGLRLLATTQAGNTEILSTEFADEESGELEFFRIPYDCTDNFDKYDSYIHNGRVIVLLFSFPNKDVGTYFIYDFKLEEVVAQGQTRENLTDVLRSLGVPGV